MTLPHGTACADDPCDYCTRRIWEAETERDYPEPMGAGEEAALDDWAERQMEAMWP